MNLRAVRPRQRLPVLLIDMNLRGVRPSQRLPFFVSNNILTKLKKYNEEVRLLQYYHKISILTTTTYIFLIFESIKNINIMITLPLSTKLRCKVNFLFRNILVIKSRTF